jgi:hypothetical protein
VISCFKICFFKCNVHRYTMVEVTFDEAVEKVNSSLAVLVGSGYAGAGAVVYSLAKVAQGTQLANFTAGVASTRWWFMVLLEVATAEVGLGEGGGLDLAGNPSMAAVEAMAVPSDVTLGANSGAGGRFGGGGVGGGGGVALRAATLAIACALAMLRR